MEREARMDDALEERFATQSCPPCENDLEAEG